MGGNMVIFKAIFDLVFYLFFDHVTPEAYGNFP
jgi:hypothetical protein